MHWPVADRSLQQWSRWKQPFGGKGHSATVEPEPLTATSLRARGVWWPVLNLPIRIQIQYWYRLNRCNARVSNKNILDLQLWKELWNGILSASAVISAAGCCIRLKGWRFLLPAPTQRHRKQYSHAQNSPRAELQECQYYWQQNHIICDNGVSCWCRLKSLKQLLGSYRIDARRKIPESGGNWDEKGF